MSPEQAAAINAWAAHHAWPIGLTLAVVFALGALNNRGRKGRW